jgi:hypothetical protein
LTFYFSSHALSANNHYQQNNLAQHKSVHENHQYPTSTAQMVSNSLNLANDYYHDPDIQIHYHSNCNNTQSGPPASPANLHQINSPDDFTTVTYKKHKNSNNSISNQYNRSHQQHQQSSPANRNVNPSSRNNKLQSIMTESATRYAQTRFPFPPFTIRFSSGNVKDKQAAEEISLFFKNQHKIDILFCNYRLSKMATTNWK